VLANQNTKKPSDHFELLYKTLLDAIPSSVLMIDDKLNVISVNQNYLVKSRRSKENTINCPLSDVFPSVILENTGFDNHIRSVLRIRKAIRGQKMTYRGPGVPIRIYYYSILPVVPGQVMLIMEDVTEQTNLSEDVRRVERHLASVVESASDIVLSIDMNGRILTWNSAAADLSGLSSDEVQSQLFHEYCEPGKKTIIEESLLYISGLRRVNDSYTIEFCLLTPTNNNNTGILISWVFSPMKDIDGATIGAVIVGRDLAERRKLELQLRQSQKLSALGIMAGGIAHEIRNPLAVCSSAAQFLLSDDVDLEFRKQCSMKIQTNIDKASTIIENLMAFAGSSMDVNMTDIVLSEALEDTIALVANQAKVQKIKIELMQSPEVILVSGVVGLLQQVFMNILLNAFKAMPSGGSVSVTIECLSDSVEVQFIDTGLGIPVGDIDKIFDPFHTSSPTGQGTGLGLSICYRIIQQHLGSIRAESSPEQGASIIINLPLLLL
jgi:PAS domain S-box-containing protein